MMADFLLGQYKLYESLQQGQVASVGMQDFEGFAYFLAVMQLLLIIAILGAMLQDASHVGGFLLVVLIIQALLFYIVSSG